MLAVTAALAVVLAQTPAGAASPSPVPTASLMPPPPASTPAAPTSPASTPPGTGSQSWIKADTDYAAGLAGAAATAIGSGVEASAAALNSFGRAVSEFGWEVSFALGVNSVPLSLPSWNPFADQDSRPEVTEDDGSFAVLPVDGQTVDGQTVGPLQPETAAAPIESAVSTDPVPGSLEPGSLEPGSLEPASLEPTPAVAVVPRPAAETVAGDDGLTARALAAAAAPAPVEASAPPSAEIIANLMGDQPHRETDGSFFVPKSAQRLLDIRTARASDGAFPVTVKLAGRIISDPNAHGVVEATIPGRIEAPPGGLPSLGALVHKGDILASVVPAIGVVDRTQIRRDVARLTNEIRVATENIEILKQFWFVPYREGKIIQAEIQLRGLRRERAALLPLLDTREVLRAPTDGVVSVTKAVAGQVVQPGTPVFDIVNPGRLWVEASAPSPEIATVAAGSDAAAAVTPEGQALDLSFVGTGLTAREQATLLQFRIDNPPEGLRVDRPVTVIVASRDRTRHGVVVPRESVVAGAGGLDEVWEHVDAEHFRARPVHTEPLDGRHMLVLDGLTAGSRIVVRSARLLAQYE